jgi:hypothetical protein
VPSASIALRRISPAPSEAAVGGHLEPGRRAGGATGVDGQHQHLAAEAVGDLGDQLRTADGRGVDRHLVGARAEQSVHVRDRRHSPADGEGDEDLLGRAGDDLHRRRPALVGGRDVEEGQLVGALGVVDPGQLHRVTGVTQLLEVDALDHPTRVHVEAGDHPHGEGHPRVSSSASSRVKRPS